VAFPQTGERLTHGSKCLGGSSFVWQTLRDVAMV
jgi:hypothetical protein